MSDFLTFSIQTRTDFRDWIMRQLGYPTIVPELTEEQLDDCINQAVEEFTEYASQDTEYLALNLKDYVSEKGYVMPSNVAAITELYDQGISSSAGGGINPFSISYMSRSLGYIPSPFSTLGNRTGWLDYHLALSWIDMSYQMTGKGFEWQYNPRTRLLVLHPDPVKYFKLDTASDTSYRTPYRRGMQGVKTRRPELWGNLGKENGSRPC